MNKKIIIGSSVGIVSALVIGILFFLGFFGTQLASANPDYICVKNITNGECKKTHCDEWSLDGKRTCYGQQTTQVAYYHVRTSCESGYTVASTGTKGTGDSGRRGKDYPSQSQSCTFIEVDNDAPIGDLNIEVKN